MATKKKSTEEESSAETKLFDVTKPGKTAASATSRPIIVGHGGAINQDPMVTPPAEDTKPSENSSLQTHGNAVISPLKAAVPVEAGKETSETGNTEPINTPDTDSVNPESSDSATVDALANEANAKKEQKKEGDENAARVLELEKIIESKQYFVPIGESKRHRSNQRILITFILLLIISVVGANFAVDAEVLDIGVKPLTDVL